MQILKAIFLWIKAQRKAILGRSSYEDNLDVTKLSNKEKIDNFDVLRAAVSKMPLQQQTDQFDALLAAVQHMSLKQKLDKLDSISAARMQLGDAAGQLLIMSFKNEEEEVADEVADEKTEGATEGEAASHVAKLIRQEEATALRAKVMARIQQIRQLKQKEPEVESMIFFGQEIPPDTLVQVKINAEGHLITYRSGTVVQVIEGDVCEMNIDDASAYALDKATLEICTPPDNASPEEEEEEECLGTIEVSLYDKDEPDPPMNINNLTGCIEWGWGNWSYNIPRIQCTSLNDVRLMKQGIHVGHIYIPFKDFESEEQDWGGGSFEWFIGGEMFNDDKRYLYSADLLTELANDLDYILNHTKKDVPKSLSYLTSFGPEIVSEIFDLIIFMPEEKRRNILCDQRVLQKTIHRYQTDGRIEPL